MSIKNCLGLDDIKYYLETAESDFLCIYFILSYLFVYI